MSFSSEFISLFLTHTCTHVLIPQAHTHTFSHTLDFSTRIFSRPRLSPDPHGRNPSGPRVATTKLQTIWKAKRKTSRGTAARWRCRQLGSGEGRGKPGWLPDSRETNTLLSQTQPPKCSQAPQAYGISSPQTPGLPEPCRTPPVSTWVTSNTATQSLILALIFPGHGCVVSNYFSPKICLDG